MYNLRLKEIHTVPVRLSGTSLHIFKFKPTLLLSFLASTSSASTTLLCGISLSYSGIPMSLSDMGHGMNFNGMEYVQYIC